MRTLASIVTVNEIMEHDNADSLELAKIGGWQCVVRKDQFKPGDLAVYIEIDSILPITEHFKFLSGKDPKIYDGIPGIRIMTKKIRGKLSQGLLMPLNILSEIPETSDVTSILGIRKYEKPLPICLRGLIKGNFPSNIPKTDLTRIQSLSEEFEKWKTQNLTWTIEEKVDGSSTTAFYENELNVCSRNLNIKETSENAYWMVSNSFSLQEKLKSLKLALQFETYGSKINGNVYKMPNISGMFFDVFDMNKNEYLNPQERNEIFSLLELPIVPQIHDNFNITNTTIDDLLELANGKSLINPLVDREGLVFRCNEDSTIRFKVISNKYLLANGE